MNFNNKMYFFNKYIQINSLKQKQFKKMGYILL